VTSRHHLLGLYHHLLGVSLHQRHSSRIPLILVDLNFVDMQSFPWFRFTLAAGALMGTGYMLMRATVPTPEETYAAMAPDLRRKVDANRAARLAREEETRKQIEAQTSNADPDQAKPVWASSK
jgi:hypothetical protein